MSTLDETLESFIREHKEVYTLLYEIKGKNVLDDTVLTLINNVKTKMQAHCQKEWKFIDENFKILAKEDPFVNMLYQTSSNEVVHFHQQINQFFIKYADKKNAADFEQDFEKMFEAFRVKSLREEKILFQEIRKRTK